MRAYELEQGRSPEKSETLVSDYLTAVSVDPNTGLKMTNLPARTVKP